MDRVHKTAAPGLGRDRYREAVRQMRAARELELQQARATGDPAVLIAAVRRGAVAPDGPAQRRRARVAAWATWGQDHELR